MKLKTNSTDFLLSCNRYDTIRKSLVEVIISKYPDFSSLNDHNKIGFLFNSIDAFICKKLDYFIYEAFSLEWIRITRLLYANEITKC